MVGGQELMVGGQEQEMEGRGARVLLKARPLLAQLVDRMASPAPDGMELYIHEADVGEADWLETLAARFARFAWPPGFTWIVEGPVWSLDGELFGICRNAEVDRELTRRLVRLAVHLGAVAVNVHCVDGSPDPHVLNETRRTAALEQAVPYLEWYVRLCSDAGLVPLVENVPPICRMRREAFIYTPIGVEPRDLLACVRSVPGLGLTLDTSHAQLAVNALRGATGDAGTGPNAGTVAPSIGDLSRAASYYQGLDGPHSLEAFIAPLLEAIVSVHVSNAAGLLDEGLPYEIGDADLDAAVLQLSDAARYFVTEPLDPDEDHAVRKREMQARLRALLQGR
ncbi:MAG: sugar phosphate isomerase/epimerase [Chloroflexota bacterium]|nr:sugar phosphate isomerase/epimerase [Chloroflexota bacterium]